MSVLEDSLRINYQPPGPVSQAFLESTAFMRGIRGPFGSGKSTLCVVDILDLALRQRPDATGKRRTRWGIVRQTYPELKTTTIKTWHEIVPPNMGRWVSEGPPTHYLQSDDIDIEVMFLALDSPADVKKLLSMELTGAWLNEAREIPKAVVDGVTGRVGRFPPRKDGGASWFGVLMDTNPPDTDHWWYTLAEGDDSTESGRQLIESMRNAENALIDEGLLRKGQKLYEFFSQPSGLSEHAENKDNLPPGYYPRLMAGKTEDWIKVYVRGEYGFLSDGKPVHPHYVESVHCWKEELEPVSGLPVIVGLDFGLTPAAAFTQRLANGRWIGFDEVVFEDGDAMDMARALKEKIARYGKLSYVFKGDPAGDKRADTDKRTVYDVLRVEGINAFPASTNDPVLRRAAVDRPLTRMIQGKPGLIISPRCKVLRKGLAGGYCYRRVQSSGSDRYHLEPDKNRFSHVVEALEYALMEGGEKASIPESARGMTKPIVHRKDWSVFA